MTGTKIKENLELCHFTSLTVSRPFVGRIHHWVILSFSIPNELFGIYYNWEVYHPYAVVVLSQVSRLVLEIIQQDDTAIHDPVAIWRAKMKRAVQSEKIYSTVEV